MKIILLFVLIIILCLYVIIGTLLYIYQRNFIYFPATAKYIGSAESVEVPSEQERLTLWRLNPGHINAVIYFGGNAEDVSGNIENFKSLFKNHTVYLLNYRGYAGSTGLPSEQGFYTDAINVYDQLKSKYTSISVIGRSLGTGVATYLAVEKEVDKLVLVTPYDSIEAISKQKYPMYPVSIMLKDKFDSYGRAKNIDIQSMVLIAEYDEVIPRHHADRLLTQFDLHKTRVEIISGASHNLLGEDTKYLELLDQYFNH